MGRGSGQPQLTEVVCFARRVLAEQGRRPHRALRHVGSWARSVCPWLGRAVSFPSVCVVRVSPPPAGGAAGWCYSVQSVSEPDTVLAWSPPCRGPAAGSTADGAPAGGSGPQRSARWNGYPAGRSYAAQSIVVLVPHKLYREILCGLWCVKGVVWFGVVWGEVVHSKRRCRRTQAVVGLCAVVKPFANFFLLNWSTRQTAL